MKYCKKCVQPDTRPSVVFDKDGVCLACRFAEKHEDIDWKARRKELEEIAEYGKKHNVSGYDCIVAVSGGKDSTRQACYVRDELGLKPLLVTCTFPPEHVTERGAHNLSNLVSLGFDCIQLAPNPKIWKEFMLQSFLKYGNLYKPAEMALYASAPKVAIAYHIPVIFLGENEAIAFGSIDVGSTSGDANKMKYCHTMQGGDPQKIGLTTKKMTKQDIIPYIYPSDEEMEWAKMRIIFLGYYIKDFTRFKNAEFAVERGLELRNNPPEDFGDIYQFSALDDDFVAANQMLKYLKFGFGQVTDQVAEAIRLGMMTREEGVELVKKYDGKCSDKFVEIVYKYLGISKKRFWQVAESFRNKNIWEKDVTGKYRIKVPLE